MDGAIMRAVDILLSIPSSHPYGACRFLGQGLWQLVLILSLFKWMGTARTVRAMTLSLRDYYIEGLRGLAHPPLYSVAPSAPRPFPFFWPI